MRVNDKKKKWKYWKRKEERQTGKSRGTDEDEAVNWDGMGWDGGAAVCLVWV